MTEESEHEWTILERNVEYETGWYRGGYDRVRQPDDSEKSYYWAELPDAVVVVARTGDDLVFVEQYRPAIRKHCLELPAGLVEDDETYEKAARRELREETGFEAEEVRVMQKVWCTTGVLRHRRVLVFARGLNPVRQQLDDNEFITVKTVPIDEALDVARRDPANDATIEGILLAKYDGDLD